MSSWQVRLFGRFELLSPAGQVITLPTRKNEALIAILVLNRKYGLHRDELAQILWPNQSAEKQRVSLRQALSVVRRALGPENLEATRTHCRLVESFQIRSDFDNPGLRAGTMFLPGCEGDWFEEIRRGLGIECERGPESDPKQEVSTPVASLLHLLQWYAEHDPSKMLGLMRENLGMVQGFKGDDLRSLLARTKPSTQNGAWKMFYEGVLMMGDGSVSIGGKQLRGVISDAERENDNLLASQAAVQVCLSACMQNRFAEAQQAANWCSAIAASSKNPRLTPTATHLQGMYLVQTAQFERGLRLLDAAEQQYQDYTDAAVMRGLQAYIQASRGKCSLADSLVQQPEKVARESGHMFLRVVCSLTRAVVRLHGEGAESAVLPLERALRLAEASQNKHLVVPARETYAQALLLVGEVSRGKLEMAEARKTRNAMSLAHTPWDQVRLAASAAARGARVLASA